MVAFVSLELDESSEETETEDVSPVVWGLVYAARAYLTLG